MDDGASRRVLEIDGNGVLAAIPPIEAVQLAEGVAFERLHLDDAGAEVADHHGGVGAGNVGRQVDDRDAVQRAPSLGHVRSGQRWRGA